MSYIQRIVFPEKGSLICPAGKSMIFNPSGLPNIWLLIPLLFLSQPRVSLKRGNNTVGLERKKENNVLPMWGHGYCQKHTPNYFLSLKSITNCVSNHTWRLPENHHFFRRVHPNFGGAAEASTAGDSHSHRIFQAVLRLEPPEKHRPSSHGSNLHLPIKQSRGVRHDINQVCQITTHIFMYNHW